MGKRLLALLTIIAVLAAAWLITVAVFAEEKGKGETTRCPYCSMDTSKSPTEVIAMYQEKGNKPQEVHFQSIGCYMHIAMSGDDEGTYSGAKVLDTSTFGGKKLRYTALEKAWYVPVKSLKGSMPPYFASFAQKADAEKYAQQHESSALGFKEVHKLVMKEIGDEEGEHSMHGGSDDMHGSDCGQGGECEHNSDAQKQESCGCCG